LVLRGWWLLVDAAAFLAVDTINAYYLAALAPATEALLGIDVELTASRSTDQRRLPVPALLVALVAASIGYAFWLLAPAPFPVLVVAIGCAGLALASPRRTLPLPLLLAAVLVAPVVGGIEVIVQRAGPFDTPFEPAAIRRLTGVDIARLVR
jgi:uncharacterized membrane protein